MKKLMTILSALLLSVGVLVGCSNDANETNNNANNQPNNETNEVSEEITVEVVISLDKGEEILEEKEIKTEDGAILLDVMKENFDIEEDGGFITSIDGKAAEEGEEKAWMYFVNDEMAMVGAGEYELSNGDEVNFDFQPWE